MLLKILFFKFELLFFSNSFSNKDISFILSHISFPSSSNIRLVDSSSNNSNVFKLKSNNVSIIFLFNVFFKLIKETLLDISFFIFLGLVKYL